MTGRPRDDIPPPSAPVPEEWERYLRAERPTDNRPVILTERQISRIQYILAAALDQDSPDRSQALAQLAAVNNFLGAVTIESADGPAGVAPSSAEHWAQIETMPHYLRPSSHARRVDELRRRGLDPYGRPLGDI